MKDKDMFCRFSKEMLDSKKVILENKFVRDIMPELQADCLKVYIYGLYKCINEDKYNTLEDFATELGMSESGIEEAFWYLDSKGLVKVVNPKPLEVVYLSGETFQQKRYDFSSNKYQDFIINTQIYFEVILLDGYYSIF